MKHFAIVFCWGACAGGVVAGPQESAEVASEPAGAKRVSTVTVERGDLRAVFRDNSESPAVLSGVQSLFHLRDAPDFDAFDPEGKGASAGLNFEHIISGHRNAANRFTPRHGTYELFVLEEDGSVELRRRAEDSPWAVESTLGYRVRAPHYIDVDFRCRARDADRFGKRRYAVFFFADYMNDVEDVALHFLGQDASGGEEKWIAADAPRGHPDWNRGGTYRALEAPPLEYDADHDFKLNSWSYDTPRFTKPFYYGRAANDMVFMILFDRGFGEEDEVRFSLFKFKLPKKPRPAWDFQYVIHRVEEGKPYGFKARVVWKKFRGAADCLREYEQWTEELRRAARSHVPSPPVREKPVKR